MKSLFGGLGLSNLVTVQLDFKRRDGAPIPTATVKTRLAETETLPLFTNKDDVRGEVIVTPVPGRRVDHLGIKVQLIGEIELSSEKGHPSEFVSLNRNLAPPGELAQQAQLPFEFDNVEMLHDSYTGHHVRVRYMLRVTLAKGYGASVVRDFPFWVRNFEPAPEPGPPIKMEVGIEDCLHIEFEYDKGRYHLNDVVVGKIYFLLVRIKLKYMEVEIRRRETTGAGMAARSDSETLAKYEIMDGAPVRGENIPIRLFLSPYDLTPSYRNVDNKFSVKYFLNLVLVDEEDRRYFKQQEISLYRAAELPEGAEKPRTAALASFPTSAERQAREAAAAAAASLGGDSARGDTSPAPAAASPAAADKPRAAAAAAGAAASPTAAANGETAAAQGGGGGDASMTSAPDSDAPLFMPEEGDEGSPP